MYVCVCVCVCVCVYCGAQFGGEESEPLGIDVDAERHGASDERINTEREFAACGRR